MKCWLIFVDAITFNDIKKDINIIIGRKAKKEILLGYPILWESI